MPRLTSSKRLTAVSAAILLVFVSLLLAACGGSSPRSTPGTTASADASASTTPATTPAGSTGARGSRFAALRECLQKNGITLPKRTPGKRPSGGFGFLGGGAPHLPSGVSRAQYEAALKKCGGGAFGGGHFKGRFTTSPKYKEALTKFAACMRENGVNLPTPNTSGSGPIFNTNGLNVSGAKFKAAETKCATILRGSFRGRRAHGAGPPSTG